MPRLRLAHLPAIVDATPLDLQDPCRRAISDTTTPAAGRRIPPIVAGMPRLIESPRLARTRCPRFI